MKHTLLICLAAILAGCGLGHPGTQDSFRAEWIIPKGEFPTVATNGSPAFAALELQGEDSVWVFHFPVKKIRKGTYLEFDWGMTARKGDWGHYRAEYSTGEEWIPMKEFRVSPRQHQPTTELATFRLGKTVRDELKIRLLPIHPDTDGPVRSAVITRKGYTGAKAFILGDKAPSDTMRVLCIGNSNTYYNNAPSLLKEIAWSQGYYFDIEMATKGGQTFGQHLALHRTMYLVRKGGYDAAILQNSTLPMVQVALFPEQNVQSIADCVALADSIRRYSPNARVFLERGFPYSAHNFLEADGWEGMNKAMDETVIIMSKASGTEISPIGQASEMARTQRPDLVLYQSDNAHPTLLLSYIKSCVNYLMLVCPDNPTFSGDVANCGIEPELASYLRSLAVKAVSLNP